MAYFLFYSAQKMMRYLYSFLLLLLMPLIPLRLLWRGFKSRSYWSHWSQRFGFHYPKNLKKTIWLHAVSLGETQASIPLIQQLQQIYPDYTILVTNMTPTGANCASQLSDVHQCYLPYDSPFAVRAFLKQIHPVIGIIIETELWPNLLHHAKQQNIPMLLANARLSAQSAKSYQRYASHLTAQTLACFSHICVQTDIEAQRFRQLGANADNLSVTGSIKFDVSMDEKVKQLATDLRQTWGEHRLVWIAASTHTGEDESVLQAFMSLQTEIPDLLLIIVPRHPERFDNVVHLCQQAVGKACTRRTQNSASQATTIYVGDTMGDLPLLYASADVAFIGGSLVPTGGHNVLEPALAGLPMVFGQHMFNFKHISQQLLDIKVATQISQAQQLASATLPYLENSILRQQTGERGQQFVANNRGALQRLLKIIKNLINQDKF